MRGLHRLLGALVVAQLAVWLVTGVLFNLKHRYAEAYEPLAAPPAEVPAAELVVPPARVAAGRGPVTLVHDPLGYAYAAGGALHDARTGAPRVPLDEAGARRIWAAALATSKHRHRYGDVVAAARERRAVVLALSSGHRITVDTLTGRVEHTGPINDFIDWSYRVHYMQYTPWKPVNVVIVLVWVGLALGLAGSGLRLLRRR